MKSLGPGIGLALIGCGEVTCAKHLPALHRLLALAAIRAGKHVWIDKPLALTAEECVQIAAAARGTSRVVMTGFHLRFHPLVAQVRRVIASGRLGTLESIRSVWNSPRGDAGLPAWRWHRETGGGAITEIGVHHFDLWRYLLGAEVREVYALSRDGSRHDENAIVTATLDNGVLATAILSERTPHDIELEICGSAGRLRAACLRFEGLEFYSLTDIPGSPRTRLGRYSHFLRTLPSGLVSIARGGGYRESYRNGWEHFVRAAQGQAPACCDAVDGLRATEILCAAHESLRRNLPVAVAHNLPSALPESLPLPLPETGSAPAPGRPLFSIVVPTYERPAALRSLLESLSAQRYPRHRFEVILVNDGAPTPIEPLVEPFRGRLQITTLTVSHRGCSGARHAGVARARGLWLAFTDDDCRPAPDWLANLEQALSAEPGAAVGGPVSNGLPGNLFADATQTMLAYLDRALNRDDAVRYLPTDNLAFPAQAFAAAGGLDPTWPLAGGEDRELCARWLRAGHRILRRDACLVVHFHPLTLASYWRQNYCYGRGARLYRTRVSAAGELRPPLEQLGFYLRLLLVPLRRHPLPRALRIIGLLALGQAANALGFFRQCLLERSPSRQVAQ
ncbi:MAG: glycosyltransferase [Acidobacteria bacterium]|nr:glycosyltransferase [Acidobacteriota bacterium]